MRLTKKLLRDIGIYNAYDYAEGKPYIFYRNQSLGRMYRSAAWGVNWPGHSFKGHWQDYGCLMFTIHRPQTEREEVLMKAKEEFKTIFHLDELAKTPFGTWMSKEFVAKRDSELVNLLKERK